MSILDTRNTSAWGQTLSSLSGALSSHLQDKMLRKMDADGSASVEQSEFQAALEKVAGKLGIEVGEGSVELYAALDTDQDGTLNGSEVGALMHSMLGAISGTRAFVQSRGDEARFAELDGNSDGMISREEFGIVPPGTPIITTTTVVSSGDETPVAEKSGISLSEIAATLIGAAIAGTLRGSGSSEEVAAAEGSGEEDAVAEAPPQAVPTPERSTTLAAKKLAESARADAVIQAADKDGNGKMSSGEFNAMEAKLAAQRPGAVTRHYSDNVLAQRGAHPQAPRHRLNATA